MTRNSTTRMWKSHSGKDQVIGAHNLEASSIIQN